MFYIVSEEYVIYGNILLNKHRRHPAWRGWRGRRIGAG